MKTPGDWFRLQLQTTAEGIIWAIRQLKPEHQYFATRSRVYGNLAGRPTPMARCPI